MTTPNLFSIELFTTDGDSHVFTDNTAERTEECVTRFFTQTGECMFASMAGIHIWSWDDITAFKFTRQEATSS